MNSLPNAFHDILANNNVKYVYALSKDKPYGVVGYFGDLDIYFDSQEDFKLAKNLWIKYKLNNNLSIVDLEAKTMAE